MYAEYMYSPQYMCILSKCAAICETYCGVTVFHRFLLSIGVGGRCILSICAFCYM